MICKIFGEKKQNYTRFWAGITTKDKEGNYVDATIPVRMSKKAEEVFKVTSGKTKNKSIKWGTYDLDDYWLNAVEGEERNFVILFVNELTLFVRDD